MVNEHSTNPEPQGSDLSPSDDVATNSTTQPDDIVQAGSDASPDDLDTQQETRPDRSTGLSTTSSSKDVSTSDSTDNAFEGDFDDVFAGVIEPSTDEDTGESDAEIEVDPTTEVVEVVADSSEIEQDNVDVGASSEDGTTISEASDSQPVVNTMEDSESESIVDEVENVSMTDPIKDDAFEGGEDWDEEDEDEDEEDKDGETMVNADNSSPLEPEQPSTEENASEPIANVAESSSVPPAQNSQPMPPPSATAQSTQPNVTASNADFPNSSSSPSVWQRIQPILTAIVVIGLTTFIQWLNLGKGALEAIDANLSESFDQDSAKGDSILITIWRKVVQPLLVTIFLFGSRALASVMGWLLSNIDADAYAAIEAGTAPTLPERIQSMPAGDKVWDVLETIWTLWARLLGFLRDRIFPESIRHWSNQAITSVVAIVLLFGLWVSSSLSPSPAQEATRGGGVTSVATDVAPNVDRPTSPVKTNSARDKSLAASIQEQLTDQLSVRYSDDLIQAVTIDRPRDLLTVTIGQEWYELNDRQQQRLAKTILSSTDDSSFNHLTLVNLDGIRIARNPVVGSEIILYQTVPPVIKEPVIEEPVIEEPVIEEPVIEEPVIEEPMIEEPVIEKTDELDAQTLEGSLEEQTEETQTEEPEMVM